MRLTFDKNTRKNKCGCFNETLWAQLKLIDLDVDMGTNIQIIACLGKIISMCNKQYLSNIWDSIH